MQYKSIWNNGVVLSFDLDYKKLKKYYSETSPENAYKIIKKFLINNGFEHIKDSDYLHNDINKIKTSILINKFSKNNIWFPLSIKKVIISPNINHLDITEEVKSIANDYNERMKKETSITDWKNKIDARKNKQQRAGEKNNNSLEVDKTKNSKGTER